MAFTYYARPSDIVTALANTVAWQSGTPDSRYPLANVRDRKAHTVTAVTGNSGTVRFTFASSQALRAIQITNTNATSITVSNGAGFNQSVPIPTIPLDGIPLDPWMDFQGLSNLSSTTWDVALSGSSPQAVGEINLIQTLRVIPVLWGTFQEEETHANIVQPTSAQVMLTYSLGIRDRRRTGNVSDITYNADLLALQRDTRNQMFPLVLIPASDINDSLYCTFDTDVASFLQRNPKMAEITLVFRECQKGWL